MRSIAILTALLFASICHADSVAVGTVADGYTFNGTHWVWPDGSLWSRKWESPYWYCGRYYNGYYRYSYAGNSYKANVNATVVEDELTEIARAVGTRAQLEAETAKIVQRYAKFGETLKIAGLTGSQYPSALQSNSLLYGTFGVNTSTVYGWQQPTLAQQVGAPLNIDQALLALSQGAQAVNLANKDVQVGFQSIGGQLVAQQMAVNAEGSKAAATIEILRALYGPPTTTNSSMLFKLEGGKISPVEVLPVPKAQGTFRDLWNQSANKDCRSCHSGDKIEGGFDLAKFGSMNPDQIDRVIDRIELPASDPKHMPKGGPELSAEAKNAWHQAAREARRQAALRQELPKMK